MITRTKKMNIGCVVPEVCSWTDRHTDRQTQSSQYFAFPTGGEVIRLPMRAVTDRIFWQTSKTN